MCIKEGMKMYHFVVLTPRKQEAEISQLPCLNVSLLQRLDVSTVNVLLVLSLVDGLLGCVSTRTLL